MQSDLRIQFFFLRKKLQMQIIGICLIHIGKFLQQKQNKNIKLVNFINCPVQFPFSGRQIRFLRLEKCIKSLKHFYS